MTTCAKITSNAIYQKKKKHNTLYIPESVQQGRIYPTPRLTGQEQCDGDDLHQPLYPGLLGHVYSRGGGYPRQQPDTLRSPGSRAVPELRGGGGAICGVRCMACSCDGRWQATGTGCGTGDGEVTVIIYVWRSMWCTFYGPRQ